MLTHGVICVLIFFRFWLWWWLDAGAGGSTSASADRVVRCAYRRGGPREVSRSTIGARPAGAARIARCEPRHRIVPAQPARARTHRHRDDAAGRRIADRHIRGRTRAY